jgi:eukaryotic-like serine/threonine-protein kinase
MHNCSRSMSHHPLGYSRARRTFPLFALMLLALAACGTGTNVGKTHPRVTPTVPLDAQLASETVYAINASPVSIAPSGWSLTALNAQTGAVRWKLPTAGMIGRPVIANGAIYFAPQDGYVYAVDAVTGHVRWRFQRTVNISAQVGIDGYPALDGDTLYVASDGGTVYALDAQTGKERWLFALPDSKGHIYAAPAVGRGKVYVSSGNGTNAFYALDEATGKIAWQFTAPQGFDGYPLLSGATVYVGADGYTLASFYALDADTGKVRWQFQANDSVITRPAFDSNSLFIGALDASLYQINAASGEVGWRVGLASSDNLPALPTGAAPTVADGVVYVGGESGVVEALVAATGTLRWQHNVDGSIDSAPAFVGGAVYVTTEKGSVYALRAADGALAWKYADGGLIYASPVVAP